MLDEEELADCFYELYVHSTKGMKKYGEDEYDKLRFSAFLYYLIKDTCFKSDRFNQSSFYQFIQKKVFCDLTQNVRTFNNRVNDLDILENAVNYAKHPDVRYFQHLKEKFQKSDYFMTLEPFCKGVLKKS